MGTPIRLVDETGIERFRGTQSPGGGAQTVKVVPVPLAFDTADILTGAVVYAPTLGDVLVLGVNGTDGGLCTFLSIPTPFDGATPNLHLRVQGLTSSDDLGVLSAGPGGDIPDNPVSGVVSPAGPGFCNFSTPVLLPSATPLVAVLDDGSGGDPGSGAGAAVLYLVIVPAA